MSSNLLNESTFNAKMAEKEAMLQAIAQALSSSSSSPYIYMSVSDYLSITPESGKLYWVIGNNGKHGVYRNGEFLEGDTVVSPWLIMQGRVRAGTAASYYTVGDTVTVKKNDADTTWVIAALDKATPADSTKTHSLTLIPQNCIESLMFDNKEPNNPNSDRKNYGNNRYAHSAIRQWLNSSANAGSWWTSQHTYDATPDYATTKDGFMKGFDPYFLDVIGKTSIIVAKNTVTDGGGSETLSDEYFYLMSKQEVGLGAENNIAEGQQFPIFTDANSRKRTYNGSSTYWWLRSPSSSSSNDARGVGTDGSGGNSYAYSARGILPACNII